MRPRGPYQIERLEHRRLLAVTLPTPAGHWGFDDGTGVIAADSSGQNRPATLGGGISWVDGNVGGGAISLNGSASAVAMVDGPVVNTAGDFTVSAWVNLASLGGFQTVVSIAGNTVAGFFLQLRADTGTFSFTRITGDTNIGGTVAGWTQTPSAGTWYHLVGVNDASAGTISLYVDGIPAATTAYTTGWTANGDTLIGHGFYNGGQVDYVNGSIDEVTIYNVALDADQVQALDSFGTIPFDEGTGTTAADASAAGNDFTLAGGAGWAAGRVGEFALSLDGTANSLAARPAAVLDTALPFSVSAWVRLNALGTTQTFVSIDGTNTSGFSLQYNDATGRFAFARRTNDALGTVVRRAESLDTATAGVWYHLIGVSDPARGSIQLYVNGHLQSSTTLSNFWTANGATVIGAARNGTARVELANARIDDVRFFNSPLSATAASIVPFFGADVQSVINIATQNTGITVSPDLFGLFMEDINYGGDGGVYSDLVRNGGFNDRTNNLNAWQRVATGAAVATLDIDTTTGPTAALNQSGRLTIASGVSASSRVGFANTGYFGVAVTPSTEYDVEFYAKATAGFTGPLTISIESSSGVVYATAVVSAISTSWTKYTATLATDANAPRSTTNRFVISTNSPSANGQTIWLGSAHMFPPSYNDSPANLRVDLMEKLAAMNAATFRVPGGNYLEGNTYADRFNWIETIGPIENRPGHMNPWGYWSTDGMGLDEYLQMAELVGARPILGLFAGYTLNGQSSTGAQLQADVQSALDELHYVLDPITTPWGALRAANGHPEPYDVREVEIGNEDWFSSTYSVRYPLFYDAIRAEFPQLKIIASHTDTGGRPFDILDEHFYNSAAWFQSQQNHYDNRAREGYKIFVGEYAAREGAPTGNLAAALGDATFIMGMLENSDLVTLSAYAPLWANVNGVQWDTDLIGFNGIDSYGSVSYWAQVMLSNNHGQSIVEHTLAGTSTASLRTMVSRTDDSYFLTVVNVGGSATSTAISLGGVSTVWPTATVTSLSGESGTSTNSIDDPEHIVPRTFTLDGVSSSFTYEFPAYSLTIIKLVANNEPLGTVPTVAVPAQAAQNPVTAATTLLSVLGDDPDGEPNLTYTWRVLGNPPAPVSFSRNESNDAKSTLATFSAAGNYEFQVTITNAGGRATTSTVTVVVQPAATAFVLTPSATTVQIGSVIPFVASLIDQFGMPIETPVPGLSWSLLSGGGILSPSGVLTATSAGSVSVEVSAPGVGTATSTINVADDLFAWYEANASAGNSLVDSTANANHATLSGNYGFGAGFIGNALNLSGGRANLPTGVVSMLNDFTISTWINPSATPQWARIFDFGTGTSVNMFLTVNAGSGLRYAITMNGNSSEQRVNGPPLPVGTWSHVAIAQAGGVATLYVNGQPVGTNTGMTLTPASLGVTNQNYIGDSQYSADPSLQAGIDDFRIYAAGLSAAEILSIYHSWNRPTIATPAVATPSPLVGTSAQVSVVGASPDGEASLSYSWSAVGNPPGPVRFDVQGTNAAKNSVARFTVSGTYTIQATIYDARGAAVTSSTQLTVTVPAVISATHDYLTAQNGIAFTFAQDIGDQDWLNLITIESVPGGEDVTPVAATYNAATRTVRYELPAGLADGDYRATLAFNNTAFDFFSLAGDVNHDRSVNFADLLVVARHFGESGRLFSEGNVNYDPAGVVDFADLLIVARQFGVTLSPLVARPNLFGTRPLERNEVLGKQADVFV